MYDELLGQEFEWFALDNVGQIALFSTAGQGIIPHLIGSDHVAHQFIPRQFELPNWGSMNVWNDFARYGLYVYDWQLHTGSLPQGECSINNYRCRTEDSYYDYKKSPCI